MGVAVEENSESLPLEILTGGIETDGTSEDSSDEDGLLAILGQEFAIPTEEFGADELTADTDPLTAYLRKLNHVEPLPAEKQQALAERYVEHDDTDAGKVLILTNLRLVVKLAKEYKRRWTNLLDLIQEGNVGLSEAITRFDPYRDVKFTSYAQYWIRAMILNYLMNNVHPVRLGNTRASRKLFYNLKKARRQLRKQGYEPTSERVAQYLDVDKEEVVRVSAQLDSPPVSLESEAPGYEDTTVGELMEADTVAPDKAVSDYQFSSQIQEAIADFGRQIEDERKRAIWFERMVAEDAKTLAELGEDWDVSKERIRQVEVQIRDDFKEFLTDELGDDIEVDWEEALLAG
jgi:RNA polymerase sigma-32 factor